MNTKVKKDKIVVNFLTPTHVDVIWQALRMIPLESDPDNMTHGWLSDDNWSEVTSAMAWIMEDLGFSEVSIKKYTNGKDL